jgi:hypothetical protein
LVVRWYVLLLKIEATRSIPRRGGGGGLWLKSAIAGKERTGALKAHGCSSEVSEDF